MIAAIGIVFAVLILKTKQITYVYVWVAQWDIMEPRLYG